MTNTTAKSTAAKESDTVATTTQMVVEPGRLVIDFSIAHCEGEQTRLIEIPENSGGAPPGD